MGVSYLCGSFLVNKIGCRAGACKMVLLKQMVQLPFTMSILLYPLGTPPHEMLKWKRMGDGRGIIHEITSNSKGPVFFYKKFLILEIIK